MAKIEIRKWLAEKNGLPRRADVTVERRTAKAILVSGHGTVDGFVACMICSRQLTEATSQLTGIGPVCADNLGIERIADTSPENVARYRESLKQRTTFESVWLPLSQIELVDGSLDAAPAAAPAPKKERVEVETILPPMERGDTAIVRLTPWIAEQKGLPEAAMAGRIERVTEKAILIGETWLPISQIVSAEVRAAKAPANVDVRDDEPVEHGLSAGRGARPFRPTVKADGKVYSWGEFLGESPKVERGRGPQIMENGQEYSEWAAERLPF